MLVYYALVGYNTASMTKTDQDTKKTQTSEEQPLIGPNSVLELTIDAKLVEETYQKVLRKAAQNLKSDGFRKGKTPLPIAESLIGAEKLINEVLQQVVPGVYEDAIKKSARTPLTYPEFNPISLKKGEDWKLEAHFAEKPQFKLGDYKKVVKNALKEAEKHEKEMEKEREKAKKAEKSAEKSEKATSKEHEHAHDEHQKREHLLQHIYADLVKSIKPQIPELLVKEDVRSELDTLVRRLQSMKLDLDTFLKQRSMTFEELSREFTYQSLGRLQLTFILDAITQTEKLTVSPQAMEEAMAKIDDPELKKRYQADPRYQEMLTQTLLRQQVADFLLNV